MYFAQHDHTMYDLLIEHNSAWPSYRAAETTIINFRTRSVELPLPTIPDNIQPSIRGYMFQNVVTNQQFFHATALVQSCRPVVVVYDLDTSWYPLTDDSREGMIAFCHSIADTGAEQMSISMGDGIGSMNRNELSEDTLHEVYRILLTASIIHTISVDPFTIYNPLVFAKYLQQSTKCTQLSVHFHQHRISAPIETYTCFDSSVEQAWTDRFVQLLRMCHRLTALALISVDTHRNDANHAVIQACRSNASLQWLDIDHYNRFEHNTILSHVITWITDPQCTLKRLSTTTHDWSGGGWCVETVQNHGTSIVDSLLEALQHAPSINQWDVSGTRQWTQQQRDRMARLQPTIRINVIT